MINTIKFLLDPFNIFILLALATATLFFTGKKAVGRTIAFTTLLFFLLISTPLAPNLLLGSLEERYQPVYTEAMTLAQKELPYHIIVLGGGHGYDDRLPPNSLLTSHALARLAEGIRLHRRLPNSKLVLSGYSASGRIPQAIMLQDTALLLGVDEEDTLIQPEPGNTMEEARVYAERFSGEERVILVTSAVHMPRSVMLFSRVGIEVIPSPSNYRLRGDARKVWFGFPSTENIEKLRSAIYEYAAMLKYKVV